ncbi:MAG: RidA family protein [Culicoidibacterales bacterium]
MSMKIINTLKAPAALGPYSQAVEVGDMLFLSGQIPFCVATNELKVATIEEATETVFDNIEFVLAEAGSSLQEVVKVTVFMKDIGQFDEMNVIYAKRFGTHKPARSTVEVAKLPKDVPVEIEVIVKK